MLPGGVVDLDGDGTEDYWVAMATSSLESLASGAPGLSRLLGNIAVQEVDSKHQRLRLSNAALQERVLRPLPCAVDLLCSLGYGLLEEGGEMWLCLDLARHEPKAAEEAAQRLQAIVERRWQPQPWPCPACTLQNAASADACAICGGLRPSWAAAPSLAMPAMQWKPAGAGSLKRERESAAAAASGAATAVPGASAAQRQASAAGVSAAKGEKLRERERILAEARADRQRFEATGGPPASAGSSEGGSGAVRSAPAAAASAASPAAAHAALKIRLSCGALLEASFAGGDALSRVFDHVDSILVARGEPPEDYSLLQAIPRRIFLREVLGTQSLSQLGLTPSATLSILRSEDRGRVESGGVERALLTGDIEGLSYEEILEFQQRMGYSKPARKASTRDLQRLTTVRTYALPPAAAENAGDTRCAICLVDFEAGGCRVRQLWCGHSFHVECVDHWLSEKDDCPVCREVMP
eukprot:TRINITY_DN41322_c0_g1_i1.p1 TRINITY_DN41322_c0_g1~~TRINITY_DN41322_c0_g1_i1.p1  ORF type:complete len:468 (-),score=126.97 TRINITY_DN41322_c0_g1_i1:253-1656(-)